MEKKLLLTLMFLGAAQMALAGVITFDTAEAVPGEMLPMHYEEDPLDPDITWMNFMVGDDSGNKYVLNGGSIFAGVGGSTFDFFAADFRAPGGMTGADSILFQGVAGGVPFSGTIDLTASFGPEPTILNLQNLSGITFFPIPGGTFHMDNLAIYEGGQSPVIPVPGAIVLGGIGTLCVGWLRRRRTI